MKYVPSLDVYGINAYGPGVNAVDGEWRTKCPNTKPYMVCEFGAKGEWDAKPDKNGLKVEPSDAEKYETIAQGWKNWIESKEMCLGGFVFNYGDSWDHGAVWLSMKMRSYLRPAYWATRKAFTGLDPVNQMPVIREFVFPKDQGRPDAWVNVRVSVEDPDSQATRIRFFYNKREGSRKKRNAILPLEMRGDLQHGYQVKIPRENGVIKMYAFVIDDAKNLSIAQTSFVVKGNAKDKLVRGLKAELPFYVFDDDFPGRNLPYVASGWMGDNTYAMAMDTLCTDKPYRGKTCIKFAYSTTQGWGGIAWQDPPNDWGKQPGGYDFTGARRLKFMARGENGGERIDFGYGIIDKKEPFYDSARDSMKGVVLTQEWQEYSFDLTGKDLRSIKTPFYFFFGAEGKKIVFYLDDIVFE
jgi:hypothetical protein